jgi:hypothetical protein
MPRQADGKIDRIARPRVELLTRLDGNTFYASVTVEAQ